MVMKGPQKEGIYKVCPCPKPRKGQEYECVKRHGTYSIVVRLFPGPKGRIYESEFPTRKDAQARMARLRLERHSGERAQISAGGNAITVGEWLDTWYAREATKDEQIRQEHKTLQGYWTNIGILKPVIGHYTLKQFCSDRTRFEEALEKLALERDPSERPASRHGQWVAKRSVGTLDRYRATLSKALAAAQVDPEVKHLVPVNVARGKFAILTLSKTELAVVAATPKQLWKPSELQWFFESIAGHRYYVVYLCYALTGARRGEWLGARWGAMNDMETHILISHTVVTKAGLQPCLVDGCDGHVGRLYKGTPKSANSVRWLPLPQQLQDSFSALRLDQRRAVKPDGWLDHGLIFPGVNGGPLDPDDVTDAFQVLTAEAGLPRLSGPHALRHLAVSRMMASGKTADEVALLTGHSPTVLRRTYQHLQPESAQTMQDFADGLLGRSQGLATVTRLGQR